MAGRKKRSLLHLERKNKATAICQHKSSMLRKIFAFAVCWENRNLEKSAPISRNGLIFRAFWLDGQSCPHSRSAVWTRPPAKEKLDWSIGKCRRSGSDLASTEVAREGQGGDVCHLCLSDYRQGSLCTHPCHGGWEYLTWRVSNSPRGWLFYASHWQEIRLWRGL